MPRSFPTQIVAYLESTFTKQFDSSEIHGKVGAVAGFLDLYNDLRPELIRLPPAEFSALVAAVAEIRFGIDQFRSTGREASLYRVTPSLRMAWSMIEKLDDQVPSGRRGWA